MTIVYIVMGATGHVGSAVAEALLESDAPVTVIARDPLKCDSLRKRGATVAKADVHDIDRLRQVFRGGQRAFLLNPPADPAGDTDAAETRTVRCILAALEDSGLERIVAESTYGAQPGTECGDLSVLYQMETGLSSLGIPSSIIRAAYYMSNWDALLRPAGEEGSLPTMYPADLKIPMVAPRDVGRIAARLLQAVELRRGLTYVEGPQEYSSNDVADAFGHALGRPVRPVVTPRDRWEDAYRALGFSAAAARSYTRMTAVGVDGGYQKPDQPQRGTTSLKEYVAGLVRKSGAAASARGQSAMSGASSRGDCG